MKIVFIGNVEIGLKVLKQVIKDGWNVTDVFTLAKKYARNTSGFVDFSPLCAKKHIGIHKFRNINDRVNVDSIRRSNPDLIIICGCQSLVCKEILDIPGLGTIGFHSSLLPKYRGRAPVNWAIIQGEKKTGVTMFYCDPEADTGDIIGQRSVGININDTCGTVYAKCSRAACRLIHDFLPHIKKGTIKRAKNYSANAYFWPKRNREDGRINWNKRSVDIHNLIRALTKPYPGAFTYLNNDKYFIWKSKISKRDKFRRGSPGQILLVFSRRGKQDLLVATRDRPIIISDIAKENSRAKSLFKAGYVFD